jgi:perosamine synthetase
VSVGESVDNFVMQESFREYIPLSVPNFSGNEQKYVLDAVKQTWVSTGGEYINSFEKEFASYAGVSSAVACQSGTAALHLILVECGISQGDLVVVPTLTFVATVNPLAYVGAEPVFMDCDSSLCLDVGKLEKYFSEECELRDGTAFDKKLNKPIKAVIAVHIFGNGAGMERLLELSARFGFLIIEDAAEAVGTFFISGKLKGKMAGTIGDFGFYSFNGNKLITTGGGGMIVCNDQKRLEHMKFLSTQAKADAVYYVHDEVGFNYRMTNLQAALGVAQLEQIETFIGTKKRNYELYGNEGIRLLPFQDGVRPNYWFYSYWALERDRMIAGLKEKRIQARTIWTLNHLQTPYRHCRAYDIDMAPEFVEHIVNIPCSANLVDKDVQYVADAMKEIEAR